ncbi:hypothetical protein PCANB_001269 [Pneumocystis canis]|nr:hypothetical protein PCK1_001272 [Pneumocystis canis]KAG5436994.1 hypothetical protein PCANB_001269 [Pneumocystis canis]
MFNHSVNNNHSNSFLHDISVDINQNLEESCSLQYHFDHFFMCYTLKNLFINYYRYGQRPECASKWKELVWCIKTKSQEKEEEQRMLREKKKEKFKGKKNSEEIWTLRTEPLKTLFNSKNI